ncbi:MAG: hypothetical protein DMG49_21875 [Acidobacteria bacterium]|nr:MAG: hypothetical protein DMG49_21875 [Acidobacteriota bacterium]
MAHLLGLIPRTLLVITTIVKRYMCALGRPCLSIDSLNLCAFYRRFGQFPAAPPLVYSDNESAATAQRPPRIF